MKKQGEIVGPDPDRLRLARHQAHRRSSRQAAELRRGEGADRAGSQAAEGDAQVRRSRRSVPEPRLRAGRLAAAGGEGAEPQRPDHAAASRARKCRRWRRTTRSSCRRVFSPTSLQAKRNTEAIEVAPEHADGGARGRVQAGRAAALRRRQRRDSPPARAQGGERPRAEGGQGKARAARAGQGRGPRPSASRSRSRAISRSPGFRPTR